VAAAFAGKTANGKAISRAEIQDASALRQHLMQLAAKSAEPVNSNYVRLLI